MNKKQKLNQNRAPIYEALERFRKMRVVPFDVPGHKPHWDAPGWPFPPVPALLKVMEEPPEGVLFLWVSRRVASICCTLVFSSALPSMRSSIMMGVLLL